ncbi:FAD/NAD(P)-binding protein [Rhizobium oryzicola]|uniref:FAD/NAD(P)-binding protein n=1 Tax=Rhizobium oryzicola TaxID=1232668 RepID=A0ABT8T1P5_9HYPH|nr:FAD/NAD(P)-binding protein [Rhizobium oryzicola]MDO1583807.1 FAD/NAD(P)-binding protein [Rhizobium oryzicola]
MLPVSDAPLIAVIGGGFSGAAFALHLVRHHGPAARIVIFEPRSRLGAGLAYSTLDPAHRINVPAGRMSLYPDLPDNFQAFVERSREQDRDGKLLAPDGTPYPRRRVFGDYVAAEIEPFLASGTVVHRRASVASMTRVANRWHVTDAWGESLLADAVVIAATHPPPALPSTLSSVKTHPKLISDVTVADALAPVGRDDSVLIVGNGLTSADVVASLAERGHRGKITSISRRGLRSRGHPVGTQDPFGDFTTSPSRRASDLLHRIRTAIREAKAQGLKWHPVLDAVRSQGFAIWRALDVPARRRIARLARPFWDAHRFRIAPQVEAVLDDAISAGRLKILAASLAKVEATETGFRVELRVKQQADTSIDVDAIVVTTGPAHGQILRSQPFLQELAEAGLLSACETGLGLACDLNANALGADGQPITDLFILGPLARGTFGELMGLPQVTEHALLVSEKVAKHLALPELPVAKQQPQKLEDATDRKPTALRSLAR